MRLNIETKQPEETLGILRQLYFNQVVSIEEIHPKTCTHKIENLFTTEGQCYRLDGILELTYDIPIHKIRIL